MDDMPSMLPPLRWESLLHTWELRPGWTLFAAVLLAAYFAGMLVCHRHGVRSVPAARAASFAVGMVLLVLTVSSAIDVYAMALFWDHMIEHLLLIMVVPCLLVLGHPLTVLRAAASTRGRGEQVDRFLTSPAVSVLTHPLVGFAVYAMVIVGTHLTSFMDSMARHPSLMTTEQVLYVAAGYLFLLTLVGAEPIRWRLPLLGRLVLVLVAMTPDTVVGIVLLQTNDDLFPVMEGAHPSWAPSALQDIHIGGGLMWAGGDGLMMLIGLGVIIALIVDQGRDAVLGSRLETIRRRTLTANVSRGETEPTAFDDDSDIDEDDAMLAAYNRMLGRLDEAGKQHPQP